MSSNPTKWSVAPFAILFLSIGVWIGLTVRSEFTPSADDLARFTGAAFGSVIAVFGAVGIYYLRELSEQRRKHTHLLNLLTKFRNLSKLTIEALDHESQEMISAGLAMVESQMSRVKRFCDDHELDDELVSDVSATLEILASGRFKSQIAKNHEYDEAMIEMIRDSCGFANGVARRAIDTLRGIEK